MRTLTTIFFFLTFATISVAQNGSYTLAVMKYSGGGDWYSNPSSIPNLIAFCNRELNMNLNPEPSFVEPGSPELFNYPFIHLTGHGNVIFSEKESSNLRLYLLNGGFLHIDDNYGMDAYIRAAMKVVFPDKQWVELNPNHPIFNQLFKFPKGLPKVHEHDGNSPQAFALYEGDRMICLYTFETDLGDGWEDPEVHHDGQKIHLEALKMGANIINYVLTYQTYVPNN